MKPAFYDAPTTRSDARPAVIFWFRVHALTMALLYAAGAWLATPGIGALAVLYAASAFVPRKPWGWSVALVAIAFGVPSVTIVVALPLLVGWMKPTTKAAFGRMPT